MILYTQNILPRPLLQLCTQIAIADLGNLLVQAALGYHLDLVALSLAARITLSVPDQMFGQFVLGLCPDLVSPPALAAFVDTGLLLDCAAFLVLGHLIA